MPQVLLVAFSNRDDAVALAASILEQLRANSVSAEFFLLDDEVQPNIDDRTLVVSFGGDGTFLRAARVAHTAGARVLGVELGKLGFLLNTPVADVLDEVLHALVDESFEPRLALSVRIPGLNEDAFAFNEVVVERARNGQMVRVQTFVDEDEYLLYSADGVLVATPTGSTGYNFSAGGPVIANELGVMVLTPIAPHFTIDRSVVLAGNSIVKLTAMDKSAAVLVDGRETAILSPGDSVVVRRNDTPVRVVATRNSELVNRLRKGLREGHA